MIVVIQLNEGRVQGLPQKNRGGTHRLRVIPENQDNQWPCRLSSVWGKGLNASYRNQSKTDSPLSTMPFYSTILSYLFFIRNSSTNILGMYAPSLMQVPRCIKRCFLCHFKNTFHHCITSRIMSRLDLISDYHLSSVNETMNNWASQCARTTTVVCFQFWRDKEYLSVDCSWWISIIIQCGRLELLFLLKILSFLCTFILVQEPVQLPLPKLLSLYPSDLSISFM